MNFKIRLKKLLHIAGMCFVRRCFAGLPESFYYILTHNYTTICCKPPRYETNNLEAIEKLVIWLDKNGVLEYDNRTWGALVVIYEK